MADFERYLPFLLEAEGGFVMNPHDPGGPTNKGITLATLQANAGLLGMRDPGLAELRGLTVPQAGIVYKLRYWDRLRADEIAHQPLAEAVVDFYVNAGGHAVKALQQCLNEAGATPVLAPDGIFGPSTFRALVEARHEVLADAVCRRRMDYYARLVSQRRDLACFHAGWVRRTQALMARSPTGARVP